VGEIAVQLGLWSKDCADRQSQLIQKTGLPTKLPASFDAEALLGVLTTDKKVKAGQVRFIMPKEIGKVEITEQVPTENILEALHQMQA
jgi:3-dehydroquinate synthase